MLQVSSDEEASDEEEEGNSAAEGNAGGGEENTGGEGNAGGEGNTAEGDGDQNTDDESDLRNVFNDPKDDRVTKAIAKVEAEAQRECKRWKQRQ